MSWERHHIEVVRTAAAGNVSRAADLLREHLASVGCDPLALRIVTDSRNRMGQGQGLQDLTDQLPGCHRESRELTSRFAGSHRVALSRLKRRTLLTRTKSRSSTNPIRSRTSPNDAITPPRPKA